TQSSSKLPQTANAEMPIMSASYTGREPVRELACPIGKHTYPGNQEGKSQLVEITSMGTQIVASAGHDASYSVSQVLSSGRLAQFSH
ncbi:MAG: hypothetical protein ACYC6L_17830, partial [Anaerolineae bacterium]